MSLSLRGAGLSLLLMGVAAPSSWGAGRAPYGGVLRLPLDAGYVLAVNDPHQAATASQRLVARLVHCRLFAINAVGAPTPELARRSFVKDGALVVDLIPGARFHDGSAITAASVIASLKRVRELRASSPMAALVAHIRPREVGPDRVSIDLPPGVRSATVRRLLARPELSVLAGGEPGTGRGCGAFRPTAVTRRATTLQAFDGHARGRPRLDRVTLTQVNGAARHVEYFVFGRVDVSFETSHRFPRSVKPLGVGRSSTVFAFVHPRWAPGQRARVRQRLWRAATSQPLARFLPWDASMAKSPWPPEMSPTSRTLDARKATGRLDDVGPVIIAYPKGDTALADLARVLRDRIRPIVKGARILAVQDVSLAHAAVPGAPVSAASSEPAQWHLGLGVYDWAAVDKAQAAWEASSVLKAGGLGALQALSGRVRRWADRVVSETRLLPLVHVRRPVYHRGAFRLVPGSGMVRYDDSYRRP